jgi:hypothetical protein
MGVSGDPDESQIKLLKLSLHGVAIKEEDVPELKRLHPSMAYVKLLYGWM